MKISSSRAAWFVFGLILGLIVLAPLAAYLLVRFGGIGMATTTKPLPFEETLAHLALHASEGDAAKVQNPLPVNQANLLAGAHVYARNCMLCHVLPGLPKTTVAIGEFPSPPQLFQSNEMVTGRYVLEGDARDPPLRDARVHINPFR